MTDAAVTTVARVAVAIVLAVALPVAVNAAVRETIGRRRPD